MVTIMSEILLSCGTWNTIELVLINSGTEIPRALFTFIYAFIIDCS